MKIRNLLRNAILPSVALTVAFTLSIPATAADNGTRPAGEKRIYINPTGKDFPILAYHAFQEELITEENYELLHDCGFNLAHGWVTDTTVVGKSLKLAEEAGVKVLVNIPQTRSAEKIPEVVRRYDQYPATVGYLLWDEPNASLFGKMKGLISAVLSISPRKLAYVNLYPNYASAKALKATDYESYLERFVTETDPQLISFDNYGIIMDSDGKIVVREGYYANLEVARKIGMKYGLPIWTFCRSTAHHVSPVPNESQLLLQAFSELAYGAKAIQYYGYATKEIDGDTDIIAPVDQNGKRTKSWYAIKKVNAQIQTVGRLLLDCEAEGVWHTGAEIPEGTTALRSGDLPYPFRRIVSGSKGVVVSHLTDGRKHYLLLVNKDFEKRQRVNVDKEGDVRRVLENGSTVTDRSSRVTLRPGAWCLYTW